MLIEGKIKTYLFSIGVITESEYHTLKFTDVSGEVMTDDKGYFVETFNISNGKSSLKRRRIDRMIAEKYHQEYGINFENPIYFCIVASENRLYYVEDERKPQTRGDYVVKH